MENGMRVDYINRYNDTISFERIDIDKFIMSGGKYLRFGWDSEKDVSKQRYIFVDPSGGPYISEGMTMGYIHDGWRGKIVRYITTIEDSKDLLIVAYPLQVVQAVENNKEEFRIYDKTGEIVQRLPSFNDAVKWLEDKYGKDL